MYKLPRSVVSCLVLRILLNQMAAFLYQYIQPGVFVVAADLYLLSPHYFNTRTVHFLLFCKMTNKSNCITNSCN